MSIARVDAKVKRIVVDLDGVLVDWNNAFHKLLTQMGAKMQPFGELKEPTGWDWCEPMGATRDQLTEAWNYVVKEPFWWQWLHTHRDVGPREWELLRELCDRYQVYFVTARPANALDPTRNWLRWHLSIHENYDAKHTVIVCPKSKLEILAGLDPDAIIEDKWETLVEYAGYRGWSRTQEGLVLVKRPYNSHRVWSPVVGSTREALEYVKGVVEG